jgi:hypothetical protein
VQFRLSGALTTAVLLGNVAYRAGSKIAWNSKLRATGAGRGQFIQHQYRRVGNSKQCAPLAWSPARVDCPMAFIYWNVRLDLHSAVHRSVVWLVFGLLFIILIVRWQFRIERKPEKDLTSFIHLVLRTIIGARLSHCFLRSIVLSQPSGRHPQDLAGRPASHGGSAGVLIAVYLYSGAARSALSLAPGPNRTTASPRCSFVWALLTPKFSGAHQVPWAFVLREFNQPLHRFNSTNPLPICDFRCVAGCINAMAATPRVCYWAYS